MSAVGVAVLLSCAGLAQAVIVTSIRPVNSTADEQAFLSSALGTAEARVGDRSGPGTWEAGQYFTSPTVANPFNQIALPATQRQVDWVSGGTFPFSLSFDRVTGIVTWTVRTGVNSTVSSTQTFAAPGQLTAFVLRARGDRNLNNDVASISLTGLSLSETGLPAVSLPNVSGPSLSPTFVTGLGYGVLGLDPTRNFTLTGDLRFDWTPAYVPTNSAVSMQIKLGTAIPEPAALGLLAPAGLLLSRRRR